MPFVTALEAFKPYSIIVSAAPETGGDERRTIVFSQATSRELSMLRLRLALVAVGLAACATFAAWLEITADLDNSRLEISQQMAERRAALLSAGTGEAGAKEAGDAGDRDRTRNPFHRRCRTTPI